MTDPDVLVGTETADDAAVYRLRDDLAVIGTLDFFTPVVDDPRDFGAVAAANALSDVYAMGGEPKVALSILAFPTKTQPLEVMGAILQGGAEKAAEAGCPLIGGHSIDDDVPKYGLSVIGVVHPDRIVRNSGAKPGDVLFLTKPLGSGILTTAMKKGKLDAEGTRRVVDVMTTLNAGAAAAMRAVGVHAATDVTGFGLLGHLRGMLNADGLAATIDSAAVPLMEGAVATAEGGICPGGTQRNLENFGATSTFDDAVPHALRLVLADAQTSGGILAAVPEDRADAFDASLEEHGVPVRARIGRIVDGDAGHIAIA